MGGEILLHSRASWHLNICAPGSFTPAKSPTTNHSVFRMEATQGGGRAGDSKPWPGDSLRQGPVMDPRSLIGPEDKHTQKASCSQPAASLRNMQAER